MSDMVPVSDLGKHYNIHLWHIEGPPADHLEGLLIRIAGSRLDASRQAKLGNVVWGLASTERAWVTLNQNWVRVQGWLNEGAPPLLHLQRYEGSLLRLGAATLWMDLAQTMIWYRTIRDRLRKLKGDHRALRVPLVKIEGHESRLTHRRMPEFEGHSLIELADRLLHRSWHPNAQDELRMFVRQIDEKRVPHFTEEGDAMRTLFEHLRDTRSQIDELVDACCPRR